MKLSKYRGLLIFEHEGRYYWISHWSKELMSLAIDAPGSSLIRDGEVLL